MKDLKTIHDNVKLLLTKYPALRSPYKRKQAHCIYWKEFEDLGNLAFEVFMNKYPKLTSAETISRAIRKVQQENYNLRPAKGLELKKYKWPMNTETNIKPPLKCPQCGANINHIPKGISSKTGKPYAEFWSCERKCGYVWRPPSINEQRHQQIMKGLREIYKQNQELKEEFRAFTRIFTQK
jgi:DNA-directed RNA polymerase subunit M/transcription elongation factor TFIIS